MRPNWENECVSKSALIEWLRPYLHTGEPIPADVLISDIQMMPPTLTQPNEPLSIEQLREMDGEPVWVVPTGKCKWATRQWCVLAADEALIPGVDHWWWSFEGYSETWIAYCRPPEGET